MFLENQEKIVMNTSNERVGQDLDYEKQRIVKQHSCGSDIMEERNPEKYLKSLSVDLEDETNTSHTRRQGNDKGCLFLSSEKAHSLTLENESEEHLKSEKVSEHPILEKGITGETNSLDVGSKYSEPLVSAEEANKALGSDIQKPKDETTTPVYLVSQASMDELSKAKECSPSTEFVNALIEDGTSTTTLSQCAELMADGTARVWTQYENEEPVPRVAVTRYAVETQGGKMDREAVENKEPNELICTDQEKIFTVNTSPILSSNQCEGMVMFSRTGPSLVSSTPLNSTSIIYPPIEIIDDCVRNVTRAAHRVPDAGYNPSIEERIAEYNSSLLYLNSHLKNTEHYVNLPFLRNESGQVPFLPKGTVLSNIYTRVEGDLKKEQPNIERISFIATKNVQTGLDKFYPKKWKNRWSLFDSLFGCCSQPVVDPKDADSASYPSYMSTAITPHLIQNTINKKQVKLGLNNSHWLQIGAAGYNSQLHAPNTL